jgi:glucose uptake protein GlcU
MSIPTSYTGEERRAFQQSDSNITYKVVFGILISVLLAIFGMYFSSKIASDNKVAEQVQQLDKRLATFEIEMKYVSQSMETLLKRVEN